MKLTTFLLMIALVQASAATFAQKLTYRKQGASLREVFAEIKNQTGYNVLYSPDQIDPSKKINANFKQTELKEVLEKVINVNTQEYSIVDKNILIKEKEKSFLENVIARFQNIDIRGKVVDKNGESLAGATIKVKGTSKVTTADVKGEFYFKDVEEGIVLEISYVGFSPISVFSKSEMGLIKLENVDAKLDEVQVIAYGSVNKKYSTGNIGNISGEAIARQPVSNMLLAMQGQVPGLNIQQTSGNTLANVKVNIQGQNSINNGNEPFYVIDGVPYAPGITSSLAGGILPQGTSSVGSAFNFINPSDIESIQILKDADATAIYGSRAANGAILITTKRGKAGQTKITLDMQSGWGKITRKLDLLNTSEYLAMRKEAYKNDGLTVPTSATTATSSNYDLTVWDQNKNTDWQDVLVGGTSKYSNVQASISGGNSNTQFLAGGGYNKQTTVYPGDLADTKVNVHFNLNHNSENNKFKFSMTSTYVQDKNALPGGGDLMNDAVKLAPNAPNLYEVDGGLNWQPDPKKPTVSTFVNPLRILERKFTSTVNNLISSGLISFEPMPGLMLKVSGGYNRLEGNEISTFPTTYFKPEQLGVTASSQFLNRSTTSYIIEPQITYSRVTDFGVFDALIGTTFQQNKSNTFSVNAFGFSNNEQLTSITAAATLSPGEESEYIYKYNALFGRVNYRFLDKYIINLTVRRDGSSRFGNENKLHNFYSLGGAWLFGSEELIKNMLPFLNLGKFRVNYGTTGNDQIGDYAYLSTLSTYIVDVPYQSSVGLQSIGHANPFLQWEETHKLNIGIDLVFLQNRISFSGNYFRNRSSNQLLLYPLSQMTGFSYVIENLPAKVQNSGIELQVDATPVNTKNFTWHISANATVPRNKLIDFPNLATSTYATTYIIGQPVTIKQLYPYAGVNSITGLYEFVDSRGLKTSTPNYETDRSVVVNVDRKWYGGFLNSLSYKNFQFDFLIQYVNQIGTNAKFGGASAGIFNYNQLTPVLGRWRNEGDISNVEKFTTRSTSSFSDGSNSSAQYSDASYLRLKNTSISYTFSPKKLHYMGLSSLRIYMQGQNLLTFTNYLGSDPESQLVSKLPPLKMYTLGLQISL
jgi:TonB-linked SusC/RagA family outer membrane protein